VVEVDPAQLDRPEGVVGADAPDPEDVDAAAAMQTDPEVNALAKAAEAEPPPASAAAPARASSSKPARTRAASRQAGTQPADAESAQTAGDNASDKQSRAADKKRRKATGVTAGRRVTRARAGATTAVEQPLEAAAPARSQRARPTSRLRSAAAEPDSGLTTSEAAAGQRDSSPAASSDCVLLGEAHEPEQSSKATSMPAPQNGSAADALPSGGQQKQASSNVDVEAAPQHQAGVDEMQTPPMSDSEHSSAMAVEPRFTADNDVNSGAQMADLAGPSGVGHEAAVPDPAAVQQVQ